MEVETLKLCEIMEVKRDDKQSGRAVNDVDCRGSYLVPVTLCGSFCELPGREGGGVWLLSLVRH